MSEEEFNSRMKAIQSANKSKERKAKLKKEKAKFKTKPKSKSKIETSKLIAVYLFIVFNIILVYTLVAMWHFGDLTYLNVLIADVAAQILLYGIYCLKAYNGKKQEEIIKFEKEKLLSLDIADLDDSEAVG